MRSETSYQQFADYVIEKWQRQIKELNIHQSGDLANSFIATVRTEANGDLKAMLFTYKFYGHFVDMGVGKGVSLEDVGITDRTAKKWFSNVIYSQVIKLTELLAKEVSYQSNNIIFNTLKGKH